MKIRITPSKGINGALETFFNTIPLDVLANKYDPMCRKEHPEWYKPSEFRPEAGTGINLQVLMEYAAQKEMEELTSAGGCNG